MEQFTEVVTARDPIMPPLANRPDEACHLVCDALSDGDHEAALMHYEPTAVVASAHGRTAHGRDDIRGMLAEAAAMKLLFSVSAAEAITAEDVALVLGTWTAAGVDPLGAPMAATGHYRSVVRRDSTGRWRIAVEHIQTLGRPEG